MNIELTESQQRELDKQHDDPMRMIDPRSKTAYVLLPATEYENIREIIEEERRQHAIREVGLRNAIGRMNEEPR
jgi:hypothetical protein